VGADSKRHFRVRHFSHTSLSVILVTWSFLSFLVTVIVPVAHHSDTPIILVRASP